MKTKDQQRVEEKLRRAEEARLRAQAEKEAKEPEPENVAEVKKV